MRRTAAATSTRSTARSWRSLRSSAGRERRSPRPAGGEVACGVRTRSPAPTGRRTRRTADRAGGASSRRRDTDVVNDAVGGLRCGTDDMVGVSVVIGTYSAVAGRSAAGRLFHFGFWPDSTGAYVLASHALAAVWRHCSASGRRRSSAARSSAGAARRRGAAPRAGADRRVEESEAGTFRGRRARRGGGR